MTKADDIAGMVEGTVGGLGLLLWGVEYVPRQGNSLVRLFIDHPERDVTIDDCESVSREVSALFDVDDPIHGAYTLEVSSPGLDRAFFRADQLARFAGETVEVNLHAPMAGRRRIQGLVSDVAGEQITLVTAEGPFQFGFDQAAKIRLKPDYAKLMRQSGSGRHNAGLPGEKR